MKTLRARSLVILIGIVVLQLHSTEAKVDEALLCSSDYCKDFVSGGKCQATSEDCDINNATHSGVRILSPTFCNCCPYCISNLFEDDLCTQGGLGSPPSGNICGPELFCTALEEDPRCKRMDGDCHDLQDKYDNDREDGTLGFLVQKPTCDSEGNFGPVVCIPGQTCFCTNSERKRIFGEVINEKSIGQSMMCPCSRVLDKKEELVGTDTFGGTRCLPDGSYDRIQCIENRCFCVHRNTGSLSSDVMIDIKVQSLTSLPCYNSDLQPNPDKYLKPCEDERYEMLKVIMQNKHEGFENLGYPLANCQADGNYDKIQINGNRKVCVTPENEPIENYFAEIETTAAKEMNCNCARTLHLLMSTKGTHKLPKCCSNGNWDPIQCRKNDCYCVDQNGSQIGIEEDINSQEKLICVKNNEHNCIK